MKRGKHKIVDDMEAQVKKMKTLVEIQHGNNSSG